MSETSKAQVAVPQKPQPGEGPLELPPLMRVETDEERRLRLEREQDAAADGARFRALIDQRRRIGYGLALFGLALLLALGGYAFRELHTLARPPFAQLAPPYFWALVAGHVAVTLALAFLGYQLLRAAERLILPYWWAETNPELARLMLGLNDPLTAGTRATVRALHVVEKAAEPIVQIVQRLQHPQAEKKD